MPRCFPLSGESFYKRNSSSRSCEEREQRWQARGLLREIPVDQKWTGIVREPVNRTTKRLSPRFPQDLFSKSTDSPQERRRAASTPARAAQDDLLDENLRGEPTRARARMAMEPVDVASQRPSRRLAERFLEALDGLPKRGVCLDAFGNHGAGVDHGRVIATAELLADAGKRSGEELSREVHRDLPRDREILRPPFRF